jgi:hypothetical protein
MSMKKPSETEEEFFARQEAEKQRRLAMEKQKQMQQEERERLKQLHHMRCPKCGMDLQAIKFRDVEIDKCYSCGGVFLDDGELDRLAGKEHGFVGKLISVFK